MNCPRCGAPASLDNPSCSFCGAVLSLVSCPSCYARVFAGARYCSRCGAETARAGEEEVRPLPCPVCRDGLTQVTVGATALRECPTCRGIWVDTRSFERICAEKERQAAVLGVARAAPASARRHRAVGPAYVPCPECAGLMNRVNFARCSGVLVDVCKRHGTWFDDEELRAIVEFIHGGGMQRTREIEKADLEERRRRLRDQQRWPGQLGTYVVDRNTTDLFEAVTVAADSIWILFG